MKIRFFIYLIIAIGFQILLGQLTNQGQGGIGMLTFIVLIEIDPNYSFSYLLKDPKKKDEKDSNKK